MTNAPPLRILYFNTLDLSGRRFNGYDILSHAQDPAFAFEMAVIWKQSDNAKVHELWPEKAQNRFLWKAAMGLGAAAGMDTFTGPAGRALFAQEYADRADMLHMHLLHSSSYFSLFPLIEVSNTKPVIWTIHDSWAFTGACVHPFACEKWKAGCRGICPHPRGVSPLKHITPAIMWQLKRNIYQKARLHLIAASNWMQSRINESPLLSKFTCHKIPFGIDLSAFSPRPRAAYRDKLGIPRENHVIAFRGLSAQKSPETYAFKGMYWLKEALKLYQPTAQTTLLIFEDGSEFEALSDKYQIINLDWVAQAELIDALRTADIFLMPSIQEAFGVMAVEAMACGVPVIVFNDTALPEVIQAPEGGLSVPARDSSALAKAMQVFLDDPERRNAVSLSARALCEREYSFDLYLSRHLSLYEETYKQDAH
jgi:glycosyltransferase involved in cell wall biosynthesis